MLVPLLLLSAAITIIGIAIAADAKPGRTFTGDSLTGEPCATHEVSSVAVQEVSVKPKEKESMGAMTPPSRKSCYNFRVVEINRVVDGDTIDVTIDLGFDSIQERKELELQALIRQRRELVMMKRKH